MPDHPPRRAFRVLAALAVALLTAPAAAAPEAIGTVIAAKETTGTLEPDHWRLGKGDPIYRNEVLRTGQSGSGEFSLADDTKLALGPGATLTLDEFVYDPAKGSPTVVVNLLAGAFRFLTGKLDHGAYRIKAGAASLAVRGTVFDVFVDGGGDLVVLLHEGAVDVCTASSACRRHDAAGKVIHVTPAGLVGAPVEWSEKLVPGLDLKRAFPFLQRRLVIDPVRRLRSLSRLTEAPLKRGAKIARKAGSTAGKVVRSTRRLLKSPF